MINSNLKNILLFVFIFISFNVLSQKPVNPNASPEARQLLNYLYEINGKETLTGMHNVLGRMSVNTDSVYQITGKYPAIWGGDFGFADSTHDIDNIKYRPLLVEEIKKQHERGSIIVLTYHQANPLIGEPCQFEGGIISKMTDEQWEELLKPGTELHGKWLKQMDLLASHLKQLETLKIPVIFRPYHEMNGSWFWWGGRKGQDGFIALWNQLFTYYTKHHQLTNLLWAWNPDKPWEGVEDFFPGYETVDLLGCDIYPMKDKEEVYPQEWYDRMYKLADGRPLALTEHSKLPSKTELVNQPWVWFMSWGEMLFNSNSVHEIRAAYEQCISAGEQK